MTARAKKLYYLMRSPVNQNAEGRKKVLKTAEDILTLKQWLVFRMRLSGQKNGDIARRMGLSDATVSEHWTKSMEKVADSFKYVLPLSNGIRGGRERNDQDEWEL